MSILDIYLNYLDESTFTKMAASGKLGKKAIEAAKKYKGGVDALHLKQLAKKGDIEGVTKHLNQGPIVKPFERWLGGVKKGTQNILTKTGTKTIHKPNVMMAKHYPNLDMKPGEDLTKVLQAHGASYAGGTKNRMHVSSEVDPKERGLEIIAKRHEADEIRKGIEYNKKYGRNTMISPVSTNHTHVSDEVLRRERELTNTARLLHPKETKETGINQLTNIRRQTGEYNNLGTKNEIRKQDKERLGIIRKSMSDAIKNIKSMTPEQRKASMMSDLSQAKNANLPTKYYKMYINKIRAIYGRYGTV